MIFFLGRSIKSTRFIYKELNNCFGLGKSETLKFLAVFGFTFSTTLQMVPFSKLQRLEDFCYRQKFLGPLYFRKYFYAQSIFIRIGSYRGRRLVLGLPLNGQRTHTNAQTPKKARISL